MGYRTMPYEEVVKKISAYPEVKYIWIEVWETSPYETEVVVTVNREEFSHLGENLVIRAGTAWMEDARQMENLKMYGKSLVRKIRRSYPGARVKSRMY